jgi:hypothetical protein
MFRIRPRVSVGITVLLACIALASCVRLPRPAEPRLSFLRIEDGRTIDESGRELTLKGCNLGNWLLLEMWMLDIKGIRD